MAETKRAWDMLNQEQRDTAIQEIIDHFQSERGEEIGLIAAEAVLDCVLQSTSKDIYKKGVDDARKILQQRFNDLEVDLDMLTN